MMARLGYLAWAPDLRGYGKASRPRGLGEYSMDKLLQDVAGLIDASRAKSVVLIGHDWGAAIAWAFAIERLRPLERLVIMNVPHPAQFQKALRTFSQLRKSWYIFFFQIPWLPELVLGFNHCALIGRAFRGMAVEKSRFPDEVLDHFRDNAAEPGALTAMLNYYRAAVQRPGQWLASRSETVRGIETPTLMVWGEEDSALGKEMTVGTEKYVRDLTIKYLPNVSHWVQQEAPEKVNLALETWLKR